MTRTLTIRHAYKRDYQLTAAKLHITITSTWPLDEAINHAMDDFAEQIAEIAEAQGPAIQHTLGDGPQ